MGSKRDEIGKRLVLARQIGREAGGMTLTHYQQDRLRVEHKADNSPVTVADREAERHLRSRIRHEFPQDGILGEEMGETEGTSPYRWVVDPIDGTHTFVSGVPLYTTLVGVLHGPESVVGVVYAPVLDEMVYAGRGRGAWYEKGGDDPRPARVSSTETLSEALLLTTEVRSFTRWRKEDSLDTYLRLQDASRLSRTWGDAYGYLLVATGRAEVMIDPIMNLWDAAPVATIMEEAGGTFTDWRGQATVHAGEGIGTNGKLLKEVLKLVAD